MLVAIRTVIRFASGSALLLTVCVACSDPRSDNLANPRPSAEFLDLFEIIGNIELEESAATINVISYVYPDPEGGFLIADGREHQVRRYADSGDLIWQTGREGDGPGEFRDPRVALRLPDRRVLVAQFNRKVTILDPTADSVLATFSTPFRRLEQTAVVGADSVLVSANVAAEIEAPRLHIWRIGAVGMEKSFFSPFRGTRQRDAAVIGGFARFAVRGDTVAATWSLTDSVFLFDMKGDRLATIPLESAFFRVPVEDPPSSRAGALAHAAWLSSFDYLAGIWWASPEMLVIRYFELLPGEAQSRRWHLVLLPLDGRPSVDVRDSPSLIHVDPASETFVFRNPDFEEPNQWLLARLK